MAGNTFTSDEIKNAQRQFDKGRIQLAKVKDNRSVTKNGAIKVWFLTSSDPEDDATRWVTVYRASFFAGKTKTLATSSSFADAELSYGENFVAPDIDNIVCVFFPVGTSETIGYYFAYIPQMNINHMIPGIPYDEINGINEPMTEYNPTDKDKKKYVFKPLSEGFKKQGLDKDLLRGPSSASVKREAPSRSYGILTPRGTQFVLDDGFDIDEAGDNWEKNKKPNSKPSNNPANSMKKRESEMIRLRTRSGAQLLISETTGHVYAINRDGTAWLELNNNGFIDAWAENGINLRTNGTMNLRADKDINIEAGGNFNVKSINGNSNFESGNNINIITTNNLQTQSGGKLSFDIKSQLDLKVPTINTDATMNIKAANIATLTIPVKTDEPKIDQYTPIKTSTQKDSGLDLTTIITRLPHKEPCLIHDESVQKMYTSTNDESAIVPKNSGKETSVQDEVRQNTMWGDAGSAIANMKNNITSGLSSLMGNLSEMVEGASSWAANMYSKITGLMGDVTSFLKDNMGLISSIVSTSLLAKSLLSKNKEKYSKASETPVDISQTATGVSYNGWKMISNYERHLPYTYKEGTVYKIGIGHSIKSNEDYKEKYPEREDDYLFLTEYKSHVEDGSIIEWENNVNPKILPLSSQKDIFNNDINIFERLMLSKIKNVVLSQTEFDAVLSFIFSLRDSTYIDALLDLSALLPTDKELFKDYILNYGAPSTTTYRRREDEVNLFFNGVYPDNKRSDDILNSKPTPNNSTTKDGTEDNISNIYNNGYNQYASKRDNDPTYGAYSEYPENNSMEESLKGLNIKNITAPDGRVMSTEEILVGLNGKMGYPLLVKEKGGINGTGVNPDNTICYGWFGSPRDNGNKVHMGCDLLANLHTPILAPYSGKIISITTATEKSNILKRIIIKPNDNDNVYISIYYADDLQVSINDNIEKGQLLAYVGDCSVLNENLTYNYVHIQIDAFVKPNLYNGIKINPMGLIISAKLQPTPSVLQDLLDNPLVEETENPDGSITIPQNGLYEFILIGCGGEGFNQTSVTKYEYDPPIIDPTTGEPMTYSYSTSGASGAAIVVSKYLTKGTYNYQVSGNAHIDTIFGENENYIKAGCGERCKINQEIIGTNPAGGSYEINDSYNIISSQNGINGITVDMVSVEDGSVFNGGDSVYNGYGKGGDLGKNTEEISNNTSGYIKIKYMGWENE